MAVQKSRKTAKGREELAAENEILKNKIRELMSEDKAAAKKDNDQMESLSNTALSLIKIADEYMIVTVLFNHETGQARVDSVKPAGKLSKSVTSASQELQKQLFEQIVFKL